MFTTRLISGTTVRVTSDDVQRLSSQHNKYEINSFCYCRVSACAINESRPLRPLCGLPSVLIGNSDVWKRCSPIFLSIVSARQGNNNHSDTIDDDERVCPLTPPFLALVQSNVVQVRPSDYIARSSNRIVISGNEFDSHAPFV
jgi:hypothetical protein